MEMPPLHGEGLYLLLPGPFILFKNIYVLTGQVSITANLKIRNRKDHMA